MTRLPEEWLSTTEPGLSADFFHGLRPGFIGFHVRLARNPNEQWARAMNPGFANREVLHILRSGTLLATYVIFLSLTLMNRA